MPVTLHRHVFRGPELRLSVLDPIAIDLGRMSYDAAYAEQSRRLEELVAARERAEPHPGFLLSVEHEAVVTITRKARASGSLIASPELLARHTVSLADTDRGGDITYHGPGQIVVYPILDLNARQLGLHAYMRLLEQAVIDTLAAHAIVGLRDPSATGVWVNPKSPSHDDASVGELHAGARKIAAMGVRVRKWISFHGLALNITTNLDHFRLIVPCGLAGRPVTSLAQLLSARCPDMPDAKRDLAAHLARLIEQAHENARADRARA